MFEARMQFEKLGPAAYISHLDLMKTLQRAFCRAQFPVRYSQGFNPHIYLSILAPLSTGYQSLCELCDFDLEEEPDGTMVSRVNQSLPAGIRVLRMEERGRSVREIAFCQWEISWREGSAVQAAQVYSADPFWWRRNPNAVPVPQRLAIIFVIFLFSTGGIA